MHGISRMVVVLLSLTVATALPGAHELPFPAAQAGHPAGCHHQPATPSPAPISYQCCVSGHGAAMPNAAFSLRASLRTMAARFCSFDASNGPLRDIVPFVHSAVLVVPSDSPPGIAPLRI